MCEESQKANQIEKETNGICQDAEKRKQKIIAAVSDFYQGRKNRSKK